MFRLNLRNLFIITLLTLESNGLPNPLEYDDSNEGNEQERTARGGFFDFFESILDYFFYDYEEPEETYLLCRNCTVVINKQNEPGESVGDSAFEAPERPERPETKPEGVPEAIPQAIPEAIPPQEFETTTNRRTRTTKSTTERQIITSPSSSSSLPVRGGRTTTTTTTTTTPATTNQFPFAGRRTSTTTPVPEPAETTTKLGRPSMARPNRFGREILSKDVLSL